MKCYYFVFCKDDLLLEPLPDGSYTIPLCENPPTEVKPWTVILNIAPLGTTQVKAYAIDTPVAPDGRLEPCPLRQSYYRLPRELYLKAGKCAELVFWDKNTRYCGVCGGTMKLHTDISKRCEHCGKEVWPQLSPAVIVRITRGTDEILLDRGSKFCGDL